MVRIEEAIRLAAEHGTANPAAAPIDTISSARATLALRRAEPSQRPPLPLRHGLRLDPVTGELTGHAAAPAGRTLRPTRPP